MTTPMQKIIDLCKKHRFTCYVNSMYAVDFYRFEPELSLRFTGTDPDEVHQKFLAVLQAMDLEPPTPTGICAHQIPTGSDWYEVIDAAAHETLRVGDRVQKVEGIGAEYDIHYFLYRSDGTLHQLMSEEGNYITLISKPLPTPDAPETAAASDGDLIEAIDARLKSHCRLGGLFY